MPFTFNLLKAWILRVLNKFFKNNIHFLNAYISIQRKITTFILLFSNYVATLLVTHNPFQWPGTIHRPEFLFAPGWSSGIFSGSECLASVYLGCQSEVSAGITQEAAQQKQRQSELTMRRFSSKLQGNQPHVTYSLFQQAEIPFLLHLPSWKLFSSFSLETDSPHTARLLQHTTKILPINVFRKLTPLAKCRTIGKVANALGPEATSSKILIVFCT